MLVQQVGHAAEFGIHTDRRPVDLAEFDRVLVRAIAVLKVWVDNHGLGPA